MIATGLGEVEPLFELNAHHAPVRARGMRCRVRLSLHEGTLGALWHIY